MKKITHEKLSNYAFVGGILLLLITGTALQIIINPLQWSKILIHTGIPIAISFFCWWMFSRTKLVLRIIHFVSEVKTLAVLFPLLLLTGSQFLYHSVLFPVCSLLVITTLIYIFNDSRAEETLFSIVITTLAFTATAILRGRNLANAAMIFGGGAVMILTCYDLEWFFSDAKYIRIKQLVALLVLVVTVIFAGTAPDMWMAMDSALINGREYHFDASFLEMIYAGFGKTGLYITVVVYSVTLVYGWELVRLNNGLIHHYSVAAMLILTTWIIGDVLKTWGIEIGFLALGIGMGSSLEIGLWFTLVFCVLPPDRLIPGGKQHRYKIALKDEEKLSDYSNFYILYSILTDPKLGFDPRDELEMWQELWFEHADIIPDDLLEDLQERFRVFCQKEGMLHDR